jgi:hypothetical protein
MRTLEEFDREFSQLCADFKPPKLEDFRSMVLETISSVTTTFPVEYRGTMTS